MRICQWKLKHPSYLFLFRWCWIRYPFLLTKKKNDSLNKQEPLSTSSNPRIHTTKRLHQMDFPLPVLLQPLCQGKKSHSLLTANWYTVMSCCINAVRTIIRQVSILTISSVSMCSFQILTIWTAVARGVNWSALVHVQDWNLTTTDQVKLKYQDCAKKYLKTDFCKGFYGLKKWESFLKGQISISNRHRAPLDASKVEVGYWYILVSLKSTFWIKDRLKISLQTTASF